MKILYWRKLNDNVRDGIGSLYLSTLYTSSGGPLQAAMSAATLVDDLQPLGFAATGVLGLATGVLDSENATLDRVHQNVL